MLGTGARRHSTSGRPGQRMGSCLVWRAKRSAYLRRTSPPTSILMLLHLYTDAFHCHHPLQESSASTRCTAVTKVANHLSQNLPPQPPQANSREIPHLLEDCFVHRLIPKLLLRLPSADHNLLFNSNSNILIASSLLSATELLATFYGVQLPPTITNMR